MQEHGALIEVEKTLLMVDALSEIVDILKKDKDVSIREFFSQTDKWLKRYEFITDEGRVGYGPSELK